MNECMKTEILNPIQTKEKEIKKSSLQGVAETNTIQCR
jgi:hypothetical protein